MKEVYIPCTTNEDNSSKWLSERKRNLYDFVPILDWLPKYKWKKWIQGDLIAGLTVGIMHVPQGMAYASLAGVAPIYGLYSSFFASIIYMMFGTSRHISIGVFAVASMMVGASKARLAPSHEELALSNRTSFPLGKYVEPLEFTSALTFMVGVLQIVLGLSRLGFLATYLSDPLVSGFTTGAAAHVFTSQLNKIFGVTLPRHEGVGMLLKMIHDVMYSLRQTNGVALVISIFGLIFLDVGRTYLNPLVKKYAPVPPPLELLLVIIGILMSVTFGLNENYNVSIVNTIPRGMPAPSIPRTDIMFLLLSDALCIAIVCYTFVMSMGKLFAKKHKYKTDATQELYAVGIMSIASSFFPVYPVGASLSRSSVCEMSGANTQFYNVFSSLLLLLVILFLGPLLEPLPMCILACIVIVSLKSLFLQVKELPRLWKICRYDFAIWVVACVATIVTDVTKGLLISVAFGLITVVIRQQWPSFTEEAVDDTPRTHIPPGVIIVKFDSPIHFVNVQYFIEKMTNTISKTPKQELLMGPEDRAILVDCSSIGYIDTMGLDALREVHSLAAKGNARIYYCAFNYGVREMIEDDEETSSDIPKTVFQPSIARACLELSRA
ncbi:unnamed protein product [Caenorhabditis auriculariae]|uniref:STAS domain-containing protein n=1 Tax=Caenorhabditis auriculariae TaxID=2777116 RepID=A0A8S1HES2_9PELO|nr:unnamed protein product [Caenorhabditis auriculariae]